MSSRSAITWQRLTWTIPLSAAMWVAFSAVTATHEFVAFTFMGLAKGSIYALIGMGFAVTYTVGNLINFAHGDVFMIGAVASTWLMDQVWNAEGFTPENSMLLATSVVVAALIGGAVSCACEVFVFRRLRTGPRLATVVASVGLALILENWAIKWNGSGTRSFFSVLPDIETYLDIRSQAAHSVAVLVITLPAVAVGGHLLSSTRSGLAIRAVGSDRNAAALMGVDITRTILLAFAIAGALAGVAGAAYAQDAHRVSYSIGMHVGLIAYASAVIGGVGSVAGTIAGGFLIGLFESWNSWLPTGLGPQWSQSVIFAMMIATLVYRPQGLWGSDETLPN